jgi:hypothetical protein
MKKALFFAVGSLMCMQVMGQLAINPQIGLNVSSFSNPPEGVEWNGNAGWNLGVDCRIGDVFQFQPGLFFISSSTGTKVEGLEAEIEDDIKHNYLKLKALGAWNIINGDDLKLRLNFGPAYDFLLSAKSKESDADLKDDFENGTFYLQGGLGIDIAFITAELGYMQGLTQTFAGEGAPDAKTRGLYLTVGMVFGGK